MGSSVVVAVALVLVKWIDVGDAYVRPLGLLFVGVRGGADILSIGVVVL